MDFNENNLEDDEVYNNIDYLMTQIKLVEIKIKYNQARINLSINKEFNTKKINDSIEIYEILIEHLKEKHIITKIINLKYEMENIELQEKCDNINNDYKERCNILGIDKNRDKIELDW